MSKLAESSSTMRRFESQCSESSCDWTHRLVHRPSTSQRLGHGLNGGTRRSWCAYGLSPLSSNSPRLSLPFRYWLRTITDKPCWMERRTLDANVSNALHVAMHETMIVSSEIFLPPFPSFSFLFQILLVLNISFFTRGIWNNNCRF